MLIYVNFIDFETGFNRPVFLIFLKVGSSPYFSCSLLLLIIYLTMAGFYFFVESQDFQAYNKKKELVFLWISCYNYFARIKINKYHSKEYSFLFKKFNRNLN